MCESPGINLYNRYIALVQYAVCNCVPVKCESVKCAEGDTAHCTLVHKADTLLPSLEYCILIYTQSPPTFHPGESKHLKGHWGPRV